jgi:hypothetical protein
VRDRALNRTGGGDDEAAGRPDALSGQDDTEEPWDP